MGIKYRLFWGLKKIYICGAAFGCAGGIVNKEGAEDG